MTSKAYNKKNNRPLDTMDEVAYHELASKYRKLKEKVGAYKKQIGGSHYKSMAMQPSEFINKNRLPFAEGSAIKYICRHAAKGKEQDIDKAIHYLEMIKERDYS